ncbi:MAG TPA: hypothetical protein VMF60_08675 [Acidimicrobiales bacterium]|nr:hypothetical protein [Acidimicrobiales bacterium]
MKRKTFDMILTAGGAALVVVFVVAGALGLWGYSFANSNVHNQLAEQQITFPTKAAFAHPKAGTEITPSMIPVVSQYAGQPLLTGRQAQVYADDFIAVHLKEIGHGQTYAQVSGAAQQLPKGSAAYAAKESEAQTIFQGTTLRGLLLEAYAFWTMGQIALWAAVVAFVLAGVMLILTVLGVLHLRRVSAEEEFPRHTGVRLGTATA